MRAAVRGGKVVTMNRYKNVSGPIVIALFACLSWTASLGAHCDAVDGPLVTEARVAFTAGDVTPLLKWVSADHADEITLAFERAQRVSKEGTPAAGSLAETWFLETLVRIHRAGEGAPYRGLQPAGQIDPAVQLADHALSSGTAQDLAKQIGTAVSEGILTRFDEVLRRERASTDLESGRAFVAAYVEYMHFVEAVHHLVAAGRSNAH